MQGRPDEQKDSGNVNSIPVEITEDEKKLTASQQILAYIKATKDLNRPFDAAHYKTINAWGFEAEKLGLNTILGHYDKNEKNYSEVLSFEKFGADEEYAKDMVDLMRQKMGTVLRDLLNDRDIKNELDKDVKIKCIGYLQNPVLSKMEVNNEKRYNLF